MLHGYACATLVHSPFSGGDRGRTRHIFSYSKAAAPVLLIGCYFRNFFLFLKRFLLTKLY